MKIEIQIERLILSGVDVSPSQRVKLQAAIEAELARLVTVNGLPLHLQGGGRIPKLPASLSLTNSSNPMLLGQEIAQAIYGGMSL
ncbi:hypothetical protein ACE1CI_17910 [Aerosakkonemataceae cyanobacterium BLCC-F50]|uniref:Uncharacterized protein n=1 Tax=Floridaenema flaviceps BLCC-F50 TaxID=3153642 RepID=A0ABV4XST4_9CYAN